MKNLLLLILFSLLLTSRFTEGNSGSMERLMKAMEQGNLGEVQKVIRDGTPVQDLNTALIFAARFGQAEIVNELLKAGADVNTKDQNNNASVLMWASIVTPPKDLKKKGMPFPTREAKIAIVKQLISAKADVNAQNAWGGTALQWSADEGQTEIVNLLIHAGADVNIADHDGLSPLMSAANYDSEAHTNVVRILLDSKANVNARNKNGDSVLMYAVNNLNTRNTELLISAGADVNAKNDAGVTPLMRASQTSRVGIMQVLIRNGANVNARTVDGDSVLTLAKRAGYESAIAVLMKAGAKE